MFVQKWSFSNQNKTCLVDFMVLELMTFTSGQLFTEHLSRNVTQLHLLKASDIQHGIQMVWYSNKAAHHQFVGPVQTPYFSFAEPNKPE